MPEKDETVFRKTKTSRIILPPPPKKGNVTRSILRMTGLFQVKRDSLYQLSFDWLIIFLHSKRLLNDTILWVLNSYPNPILTRWAFLLPVTACTVILSFELCPPTTFLFCNQLELWRSRKRIPFPSNMYLLGKISY